MSATTPSARRRAASRSGFAIVAIVLAAVLFFAVNILANASLSGVRADLTQGKIYTLSPGTRAILARIDQPLLLRFYVSSKLAREAPSYAAYATRIREFLREYQDASHGMIQVRMVDPQPFSRQEDQAVADGLQGVPVDQSGEVVYFGLAGANSADKSATIPFFQPSREPYLEYDLTKMIYTLAGPLPKAVGLLSDLPLEGGMQANGMPSQPWGVFDAIDQFFKVQHLDDTITSIPANIGVLMVVHPKALPAKTLYAIDQFVLKGGHALFFVDPVAESDVNRGGGMPMPTSSDLPRLFKAWGIRMVPGKVAGDRLAARRVRVESQSHVQVVDYLPWLDLKKQNFNARDPVMAGAGDINMATAGILEPVKGAKTTVTPLIETSDQSEEINAQAVSIEPNPASMLAGFKASGKRYMLAARIEGMADSAFPDGPPQPKTEAAQPPAAKTPARAPVKADATKTAAKPAPAHLTRSVKPINVIVVADTDMLTDPLWVQSQDFFGRSVASPFADNGDFVVNILDNLSGSNDLIGLRSRAGQARPFTVIDRLQRNADLRYQATQQELQRQLTETQKQLDALQGTGGQGTGGQGTGGSATGGSKAEAGHAILTKAQQQAIDQFRAKVVSIHQQLRQVQANLRRNIDDLETAIRVIDIALMPVLVALAALIVGLVRMRRRRRHAGALRRATARKPGAHQLGEQRS